MPWKWCRWGKGRGPPPPCWWGRAEETRLRSLLYLFCGNKTSIGSRTRSNGRQVMHAGKLDDHVIGDRILCALVHNKVGISAVGEIGIDLVTASVCHLTQGSHHSLDRAALRICILNKIASSGCINFHRIAVRPLGEVHDRNQMVGICIRGSNSTYLRQGHIKPILAFAAGQFRQEAGGGSGNLVIASVGVDDGRRHFSSSS